MCNHRLSVEKEYRKQEHLLLEDVETEKEKTEELKERVHNLEDYIRDLEMENASLTDAKVLSYLEIQKYLTNDITKSIASSSNFKSVLKKA